MARFLWLLNTPGDAPGFLRDLEPHRFDVKQEYDLANTDLAGYAAIVLTMHADQRYLRSQQTLLEDYLKRGGSILFNGHIAHPFLPGLTPFRPIEQRGLESLRIHVEGPHDLTERLTSDDLTFQRGVAGFYGRGGNPPPEGATVLTTIGRDRVPVDWLARYGAGLLYVHAGNDVFAFLRTVDPDGLTALHRFFGYFEGVSDELCRGR